MRITEFIEKYEAHKFRGYISLMNDNDEYIDGFEEIDGSDIIIRLDYNKHMESVIAKFNTRECEDDGDYELEWFAVNMPITEDDAFKDETQDYWYKYLGKRIYKCVKHLGKYITKQIGD